MSYSNDMKNELIHIPLQDQSEQVSLLAGIVRTNGTILIGSGRRIGLQVVSENAAVARGVYSLMKSLFHVEADLTIGRQTRLNKRAVYVLDVPSQQRMPALLRSLGMVDEEGLLFNADIAPDLVSRDPQRRAYLRGVFLGSGSMTDPRRSYHLEIVTQREEYAENLIGLINNYNVYPRMSSRRDNVVVYLKEGGQISDFLALIGAHDALMVFENTRIQKGMRNQVNRIVNCETANLNKAVDAAQRQIAAIHKVDSLMGLSRLPASLRDAAQARLRYPELSLKELGEAMDPPVGKSGMNHRMRRIEELAQDLENNE
jgi:DNA-binding protein WhiA